MTVELFTMSIPEPSLVDHFATRAEEEGWDGITFTDSQNLCGDPFVAIAVAGRATERLQFMTGVTNPATRHPAALATAAATAQEFTGGRVTLGIGRGDTALFHLGRKPMPVAVAASGPKVIDFAARTVERITFAVGADPARLSWAIDLARAAMKDAGRP